MSPVNAANVQEARAGRTESRGVGGVTPPIIARVALNGLDAAAAAFSWQNPSGKACIVTRVDVNVTTKSTGAGTLSIGQAATAVSAANLIDTLDVGTAAGLFSNLKNPGTNGKADQLVAAGAFVTGSKATGALAGLVGFAYIHFHEL